MRFLLYMTIEIRTTVSGVPIVPSFQPNAPLAGAEASCGFPRALDQPPAARRVFTHAVLRQPLQRVAVALGHLRKAVEVNHKDAFSWNALGWAQAQLGRLDTLEALIASDRLFLPELATAHFDLAQGRLEEAVQRMKDITF